MIQFDDLDAYFSQMAWLQPSHGDPEALSLAPWWPTLYVSAWTLASGEMWPLTDSESVDTQRFWGLEKHRFVSTQMRKTSREAWTKWSEGMGRLDESILFEFDECRQSTLVLFVNFHRRVENLAFFLLAFLVSQARTMNMMRRSSSRLAPFGLSLWAVTKQFRYLSTPNLHIWIFHPVIKVTRT